ncbi:MAG: hypothetical protein R6V03_04980 [Kiritimatiellia bacterium]
MEYDTIISTVSQHLDTVFDRCRQYHPVLLADAFDMTTGAPLMWDCYTLSNFARQQNFLRAADTLVRMTENRELEGHIDSWLTAAIEAIHDPVSGLFYWGGHSMHDLASGTNVPGNHELKCVYPCFHRMHSVAPTVTERFIEAFWHAHIRDWQTLLFNRHGHYEAWDSKWDTEFTPGPLPIIENQALSFINTGSDLIVAAAVLHGLNGHRKAIEWSQNLLSRYEQIRHSTTGLGGYQFNHRVPCRVRESFKPPLGQREDVNETSVLHDRVILMRYGVVAIALLNAAALLNTDLGKPFAALVIRDLLALSKYSYDPGSRLFMCVLNDGTRLEPDDAYADVGYCPSKKLEPVKACGTMLLAYVRGYRASGDSRLLDIAISLADGLLLTAGCQSAQTASARDVAGTLVGLCELYESTGDSIWQTRADRLASWIVSNFRRDGLFVSVPGRRKVSIDSPIPFALLHYAAMLRGNREHISDFYVGAGGFTPNIIELRRQGLPPG